MARDYYEILGVDRGASDGDIKKAFRGLARELHPDVNTEDPAAEEKFKEAAEAYEVLADPERRSTYDTYGHDGLRSGGWSPSFGAFSNFQDIFEAFFGGEGFGFGGSGGPAAGGDLGGGVEIGLAEVLTGVKREVQFEAVTLCERCRGNGAEPGTPIESCPRCKGAGALREVSRTAFGQMVRTVACDICQGDGRVAAEPCSECTGRGRVARVRSWDVDIPPGIETGQRIRISGAGHAGERGARAGDLFVLVRVQEDPRFVRDGADLVTVVDLPATDAMVGTTISVTTLDGEREVEVSPGTQPAAEVVLSGAGLPALRSTVRGGHRVVFNVVVPQNLSEEQTELAGRLAATITEDNLTLRDEGLFSRIRRAFG